MARKRTVHDDQLSLFTLDALIPTTTRTDNDHPQRDSTSAPRPGRKPDQPGSRTDGDHRFTGDSGLPGNDADRAQLHRGGSASEPGDEPGARGRLGTTERGDRSPNPGLVEGVLADSGSTSEDRVVLLDGEPLASTDEGKMVLPGGMDGLGRGGPGGDRGNQGAHAQVDRGDDHSTSARTHVQAEAGLDLGSDQRRGGLLLPTGDVSLPQRVLPGSGQSEERPDDQRLGSGDPIDLVTRTEPAQLADVRDDAVVGSDPDEVGSGEESRVPDVPLGNRDPGAEGARAGHTRRTVRQHPDGARPRGLRARAQANLAAIGIVKTVEGDLSDTQRATVAQYSGWGGLSAIFDEAKTDWEAERNQLKALLTEAEYASARSGVLDAHYTNTAYVAPMWEALTFLGFTGGRVLEPGCGSGNFIGHAPANAYMVGVELDPTTAAIAQALYPDDEIRTESYTETSLGADGYFDAAVGNVPFGDSRPYDKVYNRGNHTIHNYFINKAIAQTRPGGLVAFVTSHHTLDAKNPGFRRELYARADLVGAVRLPTGAHRATANTDVVTDILILRRRGQDETPQPFTWEFANDVTYGDNTIPVNEYFTHHPGRVLGSPSASIGLYGAVGLTVTNDSLDSLGNQIRSALSGVVREAKDKGLVFTTIEHSDTPEIVIDSNEIGRVAETQPEVFTVLTETGERELRVPKNARNELRTLLNLRDLTRQLLAIEQATLEDTPELDQARTNLRTAYESFVDQYGYLNTQRETWRKKKTDTGEVEETLYLSDRPAVRAFRNDPFAAITLAIEAYDQDDRVGKPAGLLHQRQIGVTFTPLGADTPEDALAISMAQHGRVDLDYVAYLLATDHDEIRELLGDRIFDTPEGPVIRADYLSGDVRTKLDQARQWVTDDPELYQANVTALEKAQPADIALADIEFGLGTPWIGVELNREFFEREVLGITWGTSFELSYNPLTSQWDANLRNAERIESTYRRWGTERRDGIRVFNAALNHSDFIVYDSVPTPDGGKKDVVNYEQSALFAQKGVEMREAFVEWIWKDAGRVDHLQRVYNERFNRIAPRDYSHDGAQLHFPGLASSFTPYDHQRAAVARMITQPTVGLFHEVGAGKTMEMVMGAMELRRLGLARKPMVVVPNHMLFQFANEWQQAYPNARVLIATKEDLDKKGRATFFAKATANEWDGIVITGTQFKTLGLKPENDAVYLKQQIADLKEALASSEAKDYSVRQMEGVLRRAEADLAKALDSKTDPGLTFEDLGVDYLIVDEAHLYKNLRVTSQLKGINTGDGATRATDLHKKIGWLRSNNPDGKVLTLATATPIANSITEAHTMLRYLRPDLLDTAGISAFDAFASTFTQEVTKTEAAPGGGFRQMTRIAKFQNLPEFLALWSVAADVKTADELNLKVPLLMRNEEGQRQADVVRIDSGRSMVEFSRQIEQRSKAISDGAVSPREDNMLRISTHGRRAAIDLRLVGIQPSGDTKIEAVADNIMTVYERTKDNEYLDALGEVSNTRGGLQIVFIDFSSPNSDQWNAYDGLVDELVARGMDRSQIAFMHDATNDRAKEALFAQARNGNISVLMGSTQKMGVGTNIQSRAVALHHVDAPWRPADIAQREGRIIRQGNQNNEVEIFRYVTERSFDTYMWQTLERKQHFINQVMANRVGKRVVDDIGDTELSYAQVKAAATGDPLVIERVEVEANVQKYRRLERGYRREQQYNNSSISTLKRQISNSETLIESFEKAFSDIRSTRGNLFSMTINGLDIDERAEAASRLSTVLSTDLQDNIHLARRGQDYRVWATPQVTLGGVDLIVSAVTPGTKTKTERGVNIVFSPKQIPSWLHEQVSVTIPLTAFDGIGAVTRLENFVESLAHRAEDERAKIESARESIEAAQLVVNTPFKFADELKEATARLEYLDAHIAANDLERDLTDEITWPEHATFFQGMAAWPSRGTYADAEGVDLDAVAAVATYQGGDTRWEVLEIGESGLVWGRITDEEGTRYDEFSLKDLEQAPDPLSARGGLTHRPWVNRVDLASPDLPAQPVPHDTDPRVMAPVQLEGKTRTSLTELSLGMEMATYCDSANPQDQVELVFLDRELNEVIPPELRSTEQLEGTHAFIYRDLPLSTVQGSLMVPYALILDDSDCKDFLRDAGYGDAAVSLEPLWQRQAQADLSRHFGTSLFLNEVDDERLERFMHTYGISYSPTVDLPGVDRSDIRNANIDNLRTHYSQPVYADRPLPPQGGFTHNDVDTIVKQWVDRRGDPGNFVSYDANEFADTSAYEAWRDVASHAFDQYVIDQLTPDQWDGQTRTSATVAGVEMVKATYGEDRPARAHLEFTRTGIIPIEEPATTATVLYFLSPRMSEKIPDHYRSTQRAGNAYVYQDRAVSSPDTLRGSALVVAAYIGLDKDAQDQISRIQGTAIAFQATAGTAKPDGEEEQAGVNTESFQAAFAARFRTQFGPATTQPATTQPTTLASGPRQGRTTPRAKPDTPHR